MICHYLSKTVPRKNVSKLPGYTEAKGIPTAIMVDADGKELHQGSPAIIALWKAEVEKIEAARNAAEEEPAADE